MTQSQPNNPLHGKKLADLLEQLVEHYGWEVMASKIRINCFSKDPSLKSSLKFLRKTPWARDKVERLWVSTFTDFVMPAPAKADQPRSKPARPAASQTSGNSTTPSSPWGQRPRRQSKD